MTLLIATATIQLDIVAGYLHWFIGVVCGLWGDGGRHRAGREQSSFAATGDAWGQTARLQRDVQQRPVPLTLAEQIHRERAAEPNTMDMFLGILGASYASSQTETAQVYPIGGEVRHADAIELERRAA